MQICLSKINQAALLISEQETKEGIEKRIPHLSSLLFPRLSLPLFKSVPARGPALEQAGNSSAQSDLWVKTGRPGGSGGPLEGRLSSPKWLTK